MGTSCMYVQYSTYVGQWVKPDTCHYWLLWSTEESTFPSLGNMSHQCHLWRGREGEERGRRERERKEGEERGRGEEVLHKLVLTW